MPVVNGVISKVVSGSGVGGGTMKDTTFVELYFEVFPY
jgi:hypothetical protein